MKKQYIKPASETVNINTASNILLVLSKTEETKGGEFALSEEFRSDWDNIWGE